MTQHNKKLNVTLRAVEVSHKQINNYQKLIAKSKIK